MSYTDFYTKKPTKIPTLLAVLLGIGIFGIIMKFAIPSQKSQATKKGLQTIQITNMFAGQVGILWKTDEKQKGWIVYGESENDLNQIAMDERDGKDGAPHLYHYVALKDLKKEARYFFKITDGSAFLENNGKSLFTFKTIGTVDQINNLKPAYGKVVDKSGAPVQDAIIVLNAKNVYPLTTLSKSTGEWLIPLNYTVDKSTGKFLSLSLTQPVRMYVYTDNEPPTTVTALIQQLSPIDKPLQLGQTYALQNDENVLSANSARSFQPLSIIYPVQNAVIPGQKPLIKGTGVPGTTLALSLTGGNTPIAAPVTVDPRGSWSYDLPYLLDAGTYYLSMTYKPGTGNPVSERRSFTIARSGVQVLGEATGSGTLTPSPTVVVTTPTATPIIVLQSPTPVPPSPTTVAIASSTPPPPVSGGNIYALALTSVALILFGAGLLVIF